MKKLEALLDDKVRSLRQQAYDFAKKHIASRPQLHTQNDFPADLWEKMGSEHLLGIGIPENFGGHGGDYLSIAAAGKALVEGGNNLGCSLTWLMHQISARFFLLEHGSPAQHQHYLPDMARGRITACIAISEPEGGGHPKHQRTAAKREGSAYLLTGEKTFLTNAPIADLFIVFAVVGMEQAKKRFSAFVVPRTSPGLTLAEPLDFGFLHPCPHSGIILEGCPASQAAVLGRPGSAYEDMALPFREVEDTLMMGPVSGGIRAQLNHLIRLIRDQAVPPGEDLVSRLGEIESMLSALEILAYDAAAMLENADHPQLASLLIFCRSVAAQTQAKVQDLVSSAGIAPDTLYELMTNDLVRSLRIAANISAIKQRKLGRALLS
jgi:alkylation response protein AidB-like acyl-CoA dehydrogenase